MRSFIGALCLAAFGLIGGTSDALAGPALRHAVVIDERLVVDGPSKDVQRSTVEGALLEKLVEQGVTLVDPAQSQAIRKALDPHAIVNGADLGTVTTADADVIVAGVVLGSANRPMNLNVYGCSLNAQIRVIAVDSGEILAAFTDTAMERDFTLEQAVFHAGRKLADRLATRIAESTNRPQARRIELHVATDQPVEVTVTERVLEIAKSIDGVEAVRVLHTSKNRINVELSVRAVDARTIAVALAARKRAGLFVWGYSERVIRAQLRLAKALSLSLVPTEFIPRGKGMSGDWRSSSLPRALATSLASDGLFDVEAQAKLPRAASTAKRNRLMASLKKRPDHPVLLTGSYTETEEQVAISATLVDAKSGRSIASGDAECDQSTLTACMDQLAARMKAPAGKALQGLAAAMPAPADFAERPIRVVELGSSDLYPSQYLARLRDESPDALDWVEVMNDGSEPVEDLELSAVLPRYTREGVPNAPLRLDPGESARLPLRVALDPDRLREHDRNETLVMHLDLAYQLGDFRVEDKVRRPVTLYHRNALSWADASSVASFVTATSDPIQRLARRVVQSVPEGSRKDPLALPVALFATLRSIGYVPDPVNPYAASSVDYIQYPLQTLSRGAGDCDDLAVLYSALAEAVGVHMLLVTTPGHIFVALPTDRPAHSLAAGIHNEGSALMAYEGRLWIPLETSMSTARFDEAWTEGARLVAKATKNKRLGVIDVRRSWAAHPPVDLSPKAESAPNLGPPPSELVASSSDQARQRLFKELSLVLSAIEAEVAKRPEDSMLLNRQGIVLVSLGRFDEANRAFRRSVDLGSAKPGPPNNLGNLSLLSGEAVEALHWYEQALQNTSNDIGTRQRIVMNRLLAAYLLDPAGPRFLELVLSSTDDELKSFYAGVKGGPVGEAQETEVEVDDLVHWL